MQATQSFTHVLTYRTHPVRIHLPSLTFVRPRDQQLHRVRFRTGSLTRATVLAVVSPGQRVHDRADPARSHSQLLPLPGIFLATVVVFVSIHASHSHSRVPRDSYCTQPHFHLHSFSQRETQPHDRARRPSSPVCTATSHTRSLSPHTVGHSHTVGLQVFDVGRLSCHHSGLELPPQILDWVEVRTLTWPL